MDYVDWVHKVMHAAVTVWRQASYSEKEMGFDWHDVVPTLDFKVDPRSAEFQGSTIWWAMNNALKDLDEIGWLEGEGFYYKVTRRGEVFPEGDITSAWREIMEIRLGDEEERFLEAAVEAAQEDCKDHVCVREVSWQEVFQKEGWSTDSREDKFRAGHITDRLEDSGLIRRSVRLGGTIEITPRYIGVVRVTRQAETEQAAFIRELAEEWETPNVEFKRELKLKSNVEKAKFVSRLMGLATTQSRGQRFFVIGFDDKTHEFVASVDPAITEDQLEQILHTYCQPPINIKYSRVPYLSGEAGLIEIFHNPEHVPYRVVKNLGGADGVKVDDVYVRHGRRTEAPTEAELRDLIREGEAACQQLAH